MQRPLTKQANFLKNLGDAISGIRPSNLNDAWKTALIGAGAGAGAAGLKRAITDDAPEYDPETGEDRNTLMRALLRGGVVGGASGAVLPVLSRMMGGRADQTLGGITDWLRGVEKPLPAPKVVPKSMQPAQKMSEKRLNRMLAPTYEEAADYFEEPVRWWESPSNKAPNKTVGLSEAAMTALIPLLGADRAARLANSDWETNPGSHRTDSDRLRLHGPSGLGAALGLLAAVKHKGGTGKLKNIAARTGKGLLGVAAGNLTGDMLYNRNQEQKYADAISRILPASVLTDKNLPAEMRQALTGGDASRMRDALLQISKFLPEGNNPKGLQYAKALTPAEAPSWYKEK